MAPADGGPARPVFYVSFSQPTWLDVAERLRERDGLEPVYWLGHASMEDAVRSRFPAAVFHERYDAVRNVPPAGVGDPDATVDQALLRRLAADESVVLKMMERMDIGDSFPYRQRIRLYHDQLRYWRGVLLRYRPRLVLFFSSPHFVYDYVLYALCRATGVPTLIFKNTFLPGLAVTTPAIEEPPPRLRRAYRGCLTRDEGGAIPLRAETEAHLERLAGDYRAAQPDYMTARLRRAESRRVAARLRAAVDFGGHPRRARALADGALRAARALLSAKPAHTLTKRKGRSVRTPPTVASYTLAKLRAQRQQQRLKRIYEAHAAEPELDRPFIFCALHMQPERTTSPDGGAYAHQNLMVDLLARNLPPGWLLYVKEHASQFMSDMPYDSALAQSRSASFYREIDRRPDVRLVPLDLPSFELIDRARAVATVTGTVGWEAVVRGTPTLAFGYPWYADCEGVFRTSDAAQLEHALARIESGYRPDRRRVRLFARAVELAGVHAYLYDPDRRSERLEEERVVEEVAAAIRDALEASPAVGTEAS